MGHDLHWSLVVAGDNDSAATEDGKYLEVGATVEVRGYRNRMMLVRTVNELY